MFTWSNLRDLAFLLTETKLRSIIKQKLELGKYLAILTSGSINTAYLLYSWIRERAAWSESCVLIGYPSGQDDPVLHSRDSYALVPQEKVLFLFI